MYCVPRNKAHIQQRLDQADELLERLKDFDRLHSILLQLIEEGNTLLDNEPPVGTTAQRIEEQTATCQVHRECYCYPFISYGDKCPG